MTRDCCPSLRGAPHCAACTSPAALASRRRFEARVPCACGEQPRFDRFTGENGKTVSFYACPPAPHGCGLAGPGIEADEEDRDRAADAWDRMRRKDRERAHG